MTPVEIVCTQPEPAPLVVALSVTCFGLQWTVPDLVDTRS
jgi:hypothetical protein